MILTRWLPAALTALLALSVTLRADHIILLDGNSVDAEITSISAAGDLMTDTGKPPTKHLEGLRRVERSLPAKPQAGLNAAVLLVSGGVICAQDLQVKSDVCQIQTIALGEIRIPIQSIRGFVLSPRFGPEGKLMLDDAFASALATPDATHDKLLARSEDGKLRVVSGLLREMGDQEASFLWDDQARSLGRGRVYGLVTAQANATADLGGACRFWLSDGSSFWARIKELKGDTLQLVLLGPGQAAIPAAGPLANGDVSLPWSSVLRMEVRSRREMFLSEMTPTNVDIPFSLSISGYKIDRSMQGQPLSLGGRTYEQGIGTHATSRLTYDLDGKYDVFAATIGIDDHDLAFSPTGAAVVMRSKGRGDCEFVVMADGREILRQRARSTEKPQSVSVNISGVKRLVLSVEAGEGLDLADHADWCEARVVKQEK